MDMKTKNNVVVVGNGMVGHHVVEQLVAKHAGVNITVIGAESQPAYDRVHLSEVFGGKEPDDLALTSESAYATMGVSAYFGSAVESIDRADRMVTTCDGAVHYYDKLVLATGSYPFVPPIPGSNHARCFVYRTLDDLQAIKAAGQTARSGVVVGGGLLGLECANAVKNLGLETHVVEFAQGLMGVQLDSDGSATLARHMQNLNVNVHTEKATTLIEELADGQLRMNFADGSKLDTDLIVFSAGIRPNDSLAKAAGLGVGERGGIVINSSCCTDDPHIFAVGECALYDNRIFGLVAPGYRMAEVVVSQVVGEEAAFVGADMSTKLKLLGVDVGSIGDAHGNSDGCLSYTYSDPLKNIYKRMNVSADGKHVVGAVLVGDCDDYDSLLQYYLNGLPVPSAPESLILPMMEGGQGLSVDMLPDTATICSCHNVSKGNIINTIDGGCLNIGDLKTQTKASTGCGGCAVLLKSVFDAELEKRGIEVDKSLCEHFSHTRQELFHICKVEQIKDFQHLIASHGKGLGCEICKPTAASIFASLFNDYILKGQHVGLQDTNDHALANMQKNGTYSVVPRIPGGEITPDKLIVIGQVAKKFDLYTKITGGQRIDLFGAALHELPLIWGELIDAGFETGHAYGKALRTVKTCVGSNWCRYGVQDSVAMTLYIEDRYKGLRSPHKVKMGVSGCTRECAEAQSKDIGVIATENGWNLFVGGNGGMRPRHADLFATDLDDETLIRYIDSILMFYVQTADRLQRTSVWLDNLDGGLDYLRQVIIDDSLAIRGELESQMESIVGTYQCEWKTTLADPEKLKRFRQFVNSDEQDPDVVFVKERGQRRPATEAEKAQLLVTV
jgi:nitrite reductase (NADH) large subunit